MNTKRNLGFLVFLGGLLLAASAQASVTWVIVGTAPGEPDLIGTVITPDIPVNCTSSPSICNVSGTLTIPAGALGGPGTAIDLLVDPSTVTVSISTSPPSGGDNFNLFGITVDGYTCDGIAPFTLHCEYSSDASADFVLELAPPSVAIGNGNVLITGQFLANGQPINLTPKQYAIGDIGPAGGWVFYVTTDGLHGLEAAEVDQSTAAAWGCHGTDLPRAEGTGIGAGERNTHDILHGCTTAGIAAEMAADYVSLSGNQDWYLPSKDELALMYDNLDDQIPPLGNFEFGGYYWSSSEYSGNSSEQAWRQEFGGGGQGVNPKDDALRVRAVRAF